MNETIQEGARVVLYVRHGGTIENGNVATVVESKKHLDVFLVIRDTAPEHPFWIAREDIRAI